MNVICPYCDSNLQINSVNKHCTCYYLVNTNFNAIYICLEQNILSNNYIYYMINHNVGHFRAKDGNTQTINFIPIKNNIALTKKQIQKCMLL